MLTVEGGKREHLQALVQVMVVIQCVSPFEQACADLRQIADRHMGISGWVEGRCSEPQGGVGAQRWQVVAQVTLQELVLGIHGGDEILGIEIPAVHQVTEFKQLVISVHGRFLVKKK